MTVAALPSTALYLEDGVSVAFAAPFRFKTASDLIVDRVLIDGTVVPLALGTDYSVSGGATDAGGTVTRTAASTGGRLRIRRRTARQQPMQYATGDRFPATSHEQALDRAMLIDQEQDDAIADIGGRALLLPVGDAAQLLPSAAARASRVLGFTNTGQVRVSSVTFEQFEQAVAAPFLPGFAQFAANVSWLTLGGISRASQEKLRESASLLDRGAIGDDSVQTTAVQAAHDDLLAAGGGELRVNRGVYRQAITLSTRAVRLRGEGAQASVLRPATLNGVAVRAASTDQSWNMTSISELAIVGLGSTSGIGLRVGPDVYAALAEYGGRVRVQGVRFENLDRCIERPFGNIGMWVRDCRFGLANYHFHCTANPGAGSGGVGDVMHAGNLIVENGHYSAASKASVYIDGRGVIGTCGIEFRNNVRELNGGYAFWLKGMSSGGGFPAIVIADEYNEGNATVGSVMIDGVTEAPVWLRAENCDAVLLKNCGMGPVRLLNSSVLTEDCDLSQVTATIDGLSALTHDRARRFSGPTPGLTRSIGAVINAASLASPSYRMPVPAAPVTGAGTVVFASTAQTVEGFVGSNARNTVDTPGDPGLPWLTRSQRLTINNGETLLAPPNFVLPGPRWMVFLYVARLISGPAIQVQVNGGAGVGGALVIDNAEWRTHVAVVQTPAVAGERLYHYNGGATSVIGIGGYAGAVFTRPDDALAFANSRLFPVEARPAWTLGSYGASRTLNPGSATTADTAAALATLIDDLRLGRMPA